MKYLIFSDESGRWNAGKYYIRSWIRITQEQYNLLRKEIVFAKHETSIKELKWEKFKIHYEKMKDIFSVDFKVFITISMPRHFEARKYNTISEISKITIPTTNSELNEKIRDRIIYAVKHELFFNYFEKQHIENSVKALLPSENPEEYEYWIDNPQYREWEDVARECGIKNIEIVKNSENCPGIELGDIVCGCIKDLIEKDLKAKEIYSEFIKPKMLDMQSKTYPNPNLIFFKDFTGEEKKEVDVFR